MIFEIERASVRLFWFEEDERTESEIIKELNLPKGYEVRVDINNEEGGRSKAYIKLDTLEDLMKFMCEVKHDLVLDKDENKIIIYDDWIEQGE